jgi:hypothetical protein
VKSKKINLAKHCPCSNDAFTVNEEIVAENVDDRVGIGALASGSDGRI